MNTNNVRVLRVKLVLPEKHNGKTAGLQPLLSRFVSKTQHPIWVKFGALVSPVLLLQKYQAFPIQLDRIKSTRTHSSCLISF